ncbi:hypothetical protein ACFLWV_00790 [Chloroflexota bacterium]
MPERKYLRAEDMPLDSEWTWDDEVVGEKLGPVEYRIKPSTHQRHCDLLDIHLPWFETYSYLFPWELDCKPRVVSQYKGRINNQLNASDEFEFFKAVKVSEPLIGYTENLDKWEARGKKYGRRKGVVYDSLGDVVCVATSNYVILTGHEGTVPSMTVTRQMQEEGNWHENGQLVKASKDLPDGLVLLTVTRGPCPMRISGYSHGGWGGGTWKHNMHEDAWAQSKGFRGGIVEAPVGLEYAQLQQLCNFFGPERFFTTGIYNVKTCGPVYLGDILIGKARVKEKLPENGKTRLVLDVRVERIDGDLLRVGTASAIVD